MALSVIIFSLCVAFIVYVVPLAIFRCSRPLQRALLFMNHKGNKGCKPEIMQPKLMGLGRSRTLRLEHPDTPAGGQGDRHIRLIQLGTWHIPPRSSKGRAEEDNGQSSFGDARPIVLYLHGNNGNRASDYRCALYKRLSEQLDFHVVTFDYRGFGDSSKANPSALGLTCDARFMYDWLLQQAHVSRERLIVWGHSLGAAVAVRMVAELARGRRPAKVILEAPFDSLANALANHPWARFHRRLPWFEYFVIDPIEQTPELNFNSLERIGRLTDSQVMIIHAEDDSTIAHKLGFNLYKEAARALGESRVRFLSMPARYKLAHKNAANHDDSMQAVAQFVEDT